MESSSGPDVEGAFPPEGAPVSAERSGGKAPRATQDRSRRTQESILDAAVDVLVTDGYSRATTVEVQARAGVSRGRLLHHFRSRDELLIAAVHHLAEARISALSTDRTWPEDREGRIDAAVQTMWETYQQDYFWAATELWMAARHDEALRTALEPQERRMGRFVRATAQSLFGDELAAHPRFARLIDLIQDGMRGRAMTYSITKADPTGEPMIDVWRQLAHEWLQPVSAPDAP